MPIRKYAPDVFYRIEGYLFSWLLAMVSMWSWSAGYNIVEQGDDIARCLNKRTLVVVNHQSTADVPMLMAAFNSKPGVFNHIMWIMDRIFKYTNFGVVSSFHKDFFIASVSAVIQQGKESCNSSANYLMSWCWSTLSALRVRVPWRSWVTRRRLGRVK